jgi:DNA-nicking Smr family endonuclease
LGARRGGSGKAGPPSPTAEDKAIFRDAVADARPLPANDKIAHPPQRRKPIPYQTLQDEREVLADSLSDPLDDYDPETGEELLFLRPGLSRQVLRRLRRGHWVIQGELDLHGMTSDQARLSLVAFLNGCKLRGLRCVRIIHGKGLGSRNREPVLKNKVRHWLMQREEILAFCQARPADGGGGAAVVLLKSVK